MKSFNLLCTTKNKSANIDLFFQTDIHKMKEFYSPHPKSRAQKGCYSDAPVNSALAYRNHSTR